MKTHFSPYENSGDADQAHCGTWLGESSELSFDWARVDCKSCIKLKDRIIAAYKAEDDAIVAQMGDMAKHMPALMAGGEA